MDSSIEKDGTRTQEQTGDNSNSVDLFIENKVILVSVLYLNVKTIFLGYQCKLFLSFQTAN